MSYEDVKERALRIVGEINDDSNVNALNDRISEFINYLKNNTSDKEYAYRIISACADDVDETRLKVLFYSILLQMPLCLVNNNVAFEKMISAILNTSYLSLEERITYFYEFSYRLFVTPALQADDNKLSLWRMFNSIVKDYHDQLFLKADFPYLIKEKRSKNFFVVIADQILTEEHGPTKSALDRCRALICSGNNVLLLNTGENCFVDSPVLFYDGVIANHIDELDKAEYLHYQGYKIPFCQIGKGPMDKDALLDYLHIIYDYAPTMVIDIGGNTLLGNLCNYFIPVLAVTLGPDNLVRTTEKWQTIGRKINDNDRRILQKIGYPEDKVIEMMMTFECKEQTTSLSRSDLGMKDDEFEIVVVGGRLQEEIDAKFLKMMRAVLKYDHNIRFNFCGRFSNYDEMIGADVVLSKVCRFLGMQSDMMAVLDNMDLYVNPIRLGGGTSAQEAMLKGVPVVTCKTGDVYANCHEDFAVNNYDEMILTIKKYIEDQDYYKFQSEKARKLGELEHDTIGEFNRIIEECHKRDDDNYFRN